ncbi:MAG: pseudouridine synthase [Gemmatimonadaceae bacterium]|nr:pseudouridine synthase [Gemmatimonadaceae bacterium]
MSLIKYLSRLGYGSRREVTSLVAARRATDLTGAVLRDDSAWSHAGVLVDGVPLDPPPGSLVLLHKPVGYTCSSSDLPPLVYDLLPPRFRERTPVLAPVGRLDRETSGLLLLTDDGALNHRLASPKRHVPRTYRAALAEDVGEDVPARFASGTLRLKGEEQPLRPAVLTRLGPREVEVTLTEGRYHQVRRMFAATGNHVITLHRTAIGGLRLGALPVGQWRLVTTDERALLTGTPA